MFRNKSGGQLTEPTLTAYWKEVRARSRIDRDFYSCTKHYGGWYMKVRLGLPDADERRLDELDAAFQTQPQTQPVEIPDGSGVEPVRPTFIRLVSAGYSEAAPGVG